MINVMTLILKLLISHFQMMMLLALHPGVYISQLIRFARASSIIADFKTRNKLLNQKPLQQGHRYHKLCKTFPKFYKV